MLLFRTPMTLTEVQILRFHLLGQERELAALQREPIPDADSILITQRAIERLRSRIALFPPDGLFGSFRAKERQRWIVRTLLLFVAFR